MEFVLHYYPGQFHDPKKPGILPGKHTLPKYDEVVSVPEGTTMGGGLLVVMKDGNEIATAEAWGGPSKKIEIKKISSGKFLMPELPTPAGKYVIGAITAYHTPSWSFSKIRWGTPIKDVPGEEHLPEQKKTDIWTNAHQARTASQGMVLCLKTPEYRALKLEGFIILSTAYEAFQRRGYLMISAQ